MNKDTLGIAAVIFLAFLMSGLGHLVAFTVPEMIQTSQSATHFEPTGNRH